MTVNSADIKVEPSRIIDTLQNETLERLNSGSGDVALDFSAVVRIDPDAIRKMAGLADVADNKSVRLVLRGVNLNIYKVLKLLKLAHRFTFET